MSVDWLDRISNMRINKKGDVLAPNKPLLLLIAIAEFRNNGTSEKQWLDYKIQLGNLLVDVYNKKRNAVDPFSRLVNDGLWEIVNFVNGDPQGKGFEKRLDATNPNGRLPLEFEVWLKDSQNFNNAIGLILYKYFTFASSIYDLVLQDVGLDNEYILPNIDHVTKKREKKFVKKVLAKYENTCIFCGFYGSIANKSVGVDAAHIKMHSREGEDSIENGLALCSLCHRLFDRGVITLSDNFRIIISEKYKGKIHYKHEELRLPGGELLINNVRWHRREVFNGKSV